MPVFDEMSIFIHGLSSWGKNIKPQNIVPQLSASTSLKKTKMRNSGLARAEPELSICSKDWEHFDLTNNASWLQTAALQLKGKCSRWPHYVTSGTYSTIILLVLFLVV